MMGLAATLRYPRIPGNRSGGTPYSDFRLFTGLARAARMVCMTIRMAMTAPRHPMAVIKGQGVMVIFVA